MKYSVFLLAVPAFLCVSCAKTETAAVPATNAVAAPIVPHDAAAAVKADLSPYQKPTAPGAIHLEAEDGALTGNTVKTDTSGFSGKGYVGDFEKDGAKIVWTLPSAKAGLYTVHIRYSAPFGDKGYALAVNGKEATGTLPGTGKAFATLSGGKTELSAGANTLEFRRGWGYFEVDAVDLIPASVTQVAQPPAILSDPQATPEARALLQRLVGLYGAKTLSGQINLEDTAYVQSVTGKTPAIMGGDLIEYSPSRIAHGSDPKNETERLIAASKAGQIVTLLWHWNAPAELLDNKALVGTDGKTIDASWYRGFYTNATTFDVQKALADPNSLGYKLLLRDMDAIAQQLQKLSDAHVPVLWRPLHEGEGGWFWWGAKGPDAYKKLWRLMHDRLVGVHHLHNLIWVYSAGVSPAWYPGDDVVDVVGIDEYPADTGDPLSGVWDTLTKVHPNKLVALTEFGGVPDVPKMARYGVHWSYFASWGGDLGPHKMTPADLIRIYDDPLIVNRK